MNNENRILIIDDEDLLGISLSDSLTKAGYEVHVSRDGITGLSDALSLKPKLIILDYKMPGMDGLEVLKNLREDEWGKTVEVIFATNTYETTFINMAMSLNVHDYIMKSDVSLDQITELVRKYVPPKT